MKKGIPHKTSLDILFLHLMLSLTILNIHCAKFAISNVCIRFLHFISNILGADRLAMRPHSAVSPLLQRQCFGGILI